VATPSQVDVWVGLDVGKKEHFADVLDNDGERLFARAVRNDQEDLEALLERAARHGTPGLVIDQPGSIAQLALAVAVRRGVPVALRARAGDAPRRRPVSRGGQDRPAGCLRAG
jgi:Transposase